MNTTEITYTEHYQPASIIESLILRKVNTHLVKDRCGSGATYSTLTLHKEKIILLSPTVALVKDKEEQFKAGLFRNTFAQFLYGTNQSKLDKACYMSIVERGGHLIMGTADQIMNMDYKEFAKNGYTLIIDELHVDVMSSTFRNVFGQKFVNLINTFKKYSCIITVTATPLDIYPDCMKDFDRLFLKKDNTEKAITYTEKLNDYMFFIHKAIETDKNIIFFSNDSTRINQFCFAVKERGRLGEVTVILGSSLSIESKVTYADLKSHDPRIFVCSSAATEGIDINLPDCHVIVANKHQTNFGLYSVQQVVQAIGRARNGYSECLLFNDDSVFNEKEREYDDNEIVECALANRDNMRKVITNEQMRLNAFSKYNYSLIKCDFNRPTESVGKTSKRLVSMVSNLLKLNDDDFYFDFKQVMKNVYVNNRFYGFSFKICFAYLVTNTIKELEIDHGILDGMADDDEGAEFFRELRYFRNFLICNDILKSRYAKPDGNKSRYAKPHGKEKARDISYTYNKEKAISLSFINTSPCENEKRDNLKEHKEDKKPQLFSTLHAFEYLFCYMYPSSHVKNEIKKVITHLYSTSREYRSSVIAEFVKIKIATLAKSLKNTLKKMVKVDRDTAIAIQKECYSIEDQIKKLEILLNHLNISPNTTLTPNDLTKECLSIEEVNKYIYDKTIDSHLKQIGPLYVREFFSGIIVSGYREFSSLTTILIEALAIASPFGLIEGDITQAFPMFVSAIVKDKNRTESVYDCIVRNRGVLRSQAKKLFNMYLNSTSQQIRNKHSFFEKDCGYTSEQALVICDLNKESGDAYRTFTRFEKICIDGSLPVFKSRFPLAVKSRRHDSMIVFPTYEQWQAGYKNMLTPVNVMENVQHEGESIILHTEIELEALK